MSSIRTAAPSVLTADTVSVTKMKKGEDDIVKALEQDDLIRLMENCLKDLKKWKSYRFLKRGLHQVQLATEIFIIKNEFKDDNKRKNNSKSDSI